jgi:hypothetical protein
MTMIGRLLQSLVRTWRKLIGKGETMPCGRDAAVLAVTIRYGAGAVTISSHLRPRPRGSALHAQNK